MEKTIAHAKFIANLLDSRFEIGGIRFGATTILNIIPGLGDILAGISSFYIISLGIKAGASATVVSQMIFNVGICFVVGLIPFIGDTIYIFYRPNVRNVELLERNTSKTLHGEVVK